MVAAAEAIMTLLQSGRGNRPYSLDDVEVENVLNIALALLVELGVAQFELTAHGRIAEPRRLIDTRMERAWRRRGPLRRLPSPFLLRLYGVEGT